jgi:hypothetical protein
MGRGRGQLVAAGVRRVLVARPLERVALLRVLAVRARVPVVLALGPVALALGPADAHR